MTPCRKCLQRTIGVLCARGSDLEQLLCLSLDVVQHELQRLSLTITASIEEGIDT